MLHCTNSFETRCRQTEARRMKTFSVRVLSELPPARVRVGFLLSGSCPGCRRRLVRVLSGLCRCRSQSAQCRITPGIVQVLFQKFKRLGADRHVAEAPTAALPSPARRIVPRLMNRGTDLATGLRTRARRIGVARRVGVTLGAAWLAAAWFAAAWLAAGGAGPASAESRAKERLAADLELLTAGQMEDSPIVPKGDRKRTAKCLAQALVADIPEAEAARLSDIFEGRVSKSDPALQKKWLTIDAKTAPARNAQVLQAVDKLCPDLGPYVKQMM